MERLHKMFCCKSHMYLFKLKLIKIRLYFKCSIAKHDQWLPYWRALSLRVTFEELVLSYLAWLKSQRHKLCFWIVPQHKSR